MPALAVGPGAAADLHPERHLVLGHPGGDPAVRGRAEVVGVRDERVPEALLPSASSSRTRPARCTGRRARRAPGRAPGPAATRPGSGRRRAASAPCSAGSPAAARRPARSSYSLRIGERLRRWCGRSSSAPAAARRRTSAGVLRICRAMMSRKLSPSLTGSADFGPVTPIDVPRPPFSLITTVSASAARIASASVSRWSRCGRSPTGSMSSSRIVPLLTGLEQPVVVREDRDRDVGGAGRAHLLLGLAETFITHGANDRWPGPRRACGGRCGGRCHIPSLRVAAFEAFEAGMAAGSARGTAVAQRAGPATRRRGPVRDRVPRTAGRVRADGRGVRRAAARAGGRTADRLVRVARHPGAAADPARRQRPRLGSRPRPAWSRAASGCPNHRSTSASTPSGPPSWCCARRLAVDESGVRLGRGGGSYDRALAHLPPETPVVAVVYDTEVVPELPSDPHDHRVGFALTPTRLVPLRPRVS